MTLEEFDKQMIIVLEKRKHATSVVREANLLHDNTLQRAGVEHTDREPGFPCWKVKGVEMRYCGSPREALEEANRIRGLDMTVAEAREKRVCRICKKSITYGGTPKHTFNFGKEFAHTDCLPVETFKTC